MFGDSVQIATAVEIMYRRIKSPCPGAEHQEDRQTHCPFLFLTSFVLGVSFMDA